MKKCVIIHNPNSGKKRKKEFLSKCEEILKEYGYSAQVILSEYAGHITKIVRELEDVDLVLTIGGDGTFNESMNGNLQRDKRLVLGHIPLGTTNDIGAMFGYGHDLVKNLHLLLSGEVHGIDIGMINDHAFIYVAGFGKFMNVPYDTKRNTKKKLGYLAYVLNATREFFLPIKLHELSYEIDGVEYSGLYSFMLVSNANRIAGINNFFDNVKLDDGKFEVLFSNLTRKKDVLKTLYYLRTSDIDKVPGIYFHKTGHIKIKFKNKALPWCMDGEKIDLDTKEYEIRLEKDVQIMMPSKNVHSLFVDNQK